MLVDVVTLKKFGQPEHAARPRVFVQCLDKQESSADITISNKTWIGTNSELQIYLAVCVLSGSVNETRRMRMDGQAQL